MTPILVEHTFVTTLDHGAALAAARGLLALKGFRPQPPGAAAADDDGFLLLHRGLAKPQRTTAVYDLPQDVRLEFDRGRVNVAASIQPFRAGHSLHADLLLAVARSLELLLVQRLPEQEALAPLAEVEQRITDFDAAARRERRRFSLIAWGIVLAVVGVLVLIIVMVP